MSKNRDKNRKKMYMHSKCVFLQEVHRRFNYLTAAVYNINLEYSFHTHHIIKGVVEYSKLVHVVVSASFYNLRPFRNSKRRILTLK